MTETKVRPPGHDARTGVTAVSDAGGFSVREITDPGECREVEQFFAPEWGADTRTSDAYVVGAYAGDDLLGAAAGVPADTLDGAPIPHLHSHLIGVVPDNRNRQIGTALRLHQRAWSLERGLDRITWTFDPLARRDAHFSLTKLGARVIRYIVDFHADMQDGPNPARGGDQLLVQWLLDDPQVAVDAGDRFAAEPETSTALRCGPDHAPEIDREHHDSVAWICEIPPDIEAIRNTDPDLALSWRVALRAVMHGAMSDGAQVVAFDRDRGYLLIDTSR